MVGRLVHSNWYTECRVIGDNERHELKPLTPSMYDTDLLQGLGAVKLTISMAVLFFEYAVLQVRALPV